MAAPSNMSLKGLADWVESINLIVKDNSATNAGPSTDIVGSASGAKDIVVKLPATIKANITGNVTGSSGSCTGNAATATTATKIRVTDSDSNSFYPIVFSRGSDANTDYDALVDADSILVSPGSAGGAGKQGTAILQVGNFIASSTAGNKRGEIHLYGTGTACTRLRSDSITYTIVSFPNKSGTVALTSDVDAVAYKVRIGAPGNPSSGDIWIA